MFTVQTIAQNIEPFITEETDLVFGGGGSYKSDTPSND